MVDGGGSRNLFPYCPYLCGLEVGVVKGHGPDASFTIQLG
jgi:hypothetical protein